MDRSRILSTPLSHELTGMGTKPRSDTISSRASKLRHTAHSISRMKLTRMVLAVIGLLATFFSLVISNVGATVLLVPLAINMANASGLDPRLAALAVGLATSNSFILPTHQVNALYMGPGGYRSTDFLKAGVVMSVLFLVIMVAMMAVMYGL